MISTFLLPSIYVINKTSKAIHILGLNFEEQLTLHVYDPLVADQNFEISFVYMNFVGVF